MPSSISSSTSYNNNNDGYSQVNNSNIMNIESPDQNFIGALKEWAIICKALEDGDQIILFRKGGIMEYRNGFELKYKNFLLFPTFEHQDKNSIQPEYHEELRRLENGFMKENGNNDTNLIDNIIVNSFVEITYYDQVSKLDKLENLKKFHIWNDEYVKTRFNYNPKKPLYVLLLRTYKLDNPLQLSNRSNWAGCKSWIQIDINDQKLNRYFTHDFSSSNVFDYLKSVSKPCIDDNNFNNLSREVRSCMG